MGITTATAWDGQRADPFGHPALFYADDQAYLAGLVPFIEEGLGRSQPVAVAAPTDRLGLLRGALGAAAAAVRMIDMTIAGRNPGRIIPTVLAAFADSHPGQHVRIIGEPIWPARTPAEYPACVQHEALINLAFTGRDLTLLCPYDTAGLDRRIIDDARATHPIVWYADTWQVSDAYAPQAVLSRYNLPLPPSSDAATFTVRTMVDIAGARRFVTQQSTRFGMHPDRASDLRLIVTELAANSLRHAGSPCQLYIWHDATGLVCTANDSGHLTDPLAGRRTPKPGQIGGRGLLLVNQCADLVRVHTGPTGTTIQVHIEIR